MSADVRHRLVEALPDFDVRAARGSSGPWLATAGGAPPFRIVEVGGNDCLWHADRVAQIAQDLDAAQDLLDRIEAASGWRFEPTNLIERGHAEIVRLANGEVAIELALDGIAAVPDRLVVAVAEAPRPGDRPYPTTLLITGPALSIEDAAALGVGDLLLLPMPAAARVEGREGACFALDPLTGALSITRWSPDAGSRTALEVRAEFALAPVPIAPDSLLAAENGASLELGPLPPAMPVEVTIAGRAFASGSLVRLGSTTAVRIETLITALEAAA